MTAEVKQELQLQSTHEPPGIQENGSRKECSMELTPLDVKRQLQFTEMGNFVLITDPIPTNYAGGMIWDVQHWASLVKPKVDRICRSKPARSGKEIIQKN